MEKLVEKPFSGKIDSIQLIRTIAAVCIMLYHIELIHSQELHLNFGVHIFFIISGFLVMYTTQDKPKKNFFLKRMLRLLPLYWGLTIITFLIMKFTHFFPENASISEFFKSMLFIPYEKTGRMGIGIKPIIGPGWTLYFEVYFTIIFAFSARISYKFRGVIAGLVCAGISLIGIFFFKRKYVR